MSPAATTLCEAFQATAARHADQIALRTANGSVELTFAEYAARVRRIAAGLAALGVRRGDTVGLLMANRPEFHLCDTAAIHLGATPFSVYGTLAPGDIDETTLSDALYTGGMPDPDLLIRTAGELRVSNFLLWQISYAELWVTDKCWPEFDRACLHAALRDYASRERRFGGLKD